MRGWDIGGGQYTYTRASSGFSICKPRTDRSTRYTWWILTRGPNIYIMWYIIIVPSEGSRSPSQGNRLQPNLFVTFIRIDNQISFSRTTCPGESSRISADFVKQNIHPEKQICIQKKFVCNGVANTRPILSSRRRCVYNIFVIYKWGKMGYFC